MRPRQHEPVLPSEGRPYRNVVCKTDSKGEQWSRSSLPAAGPDWMLRSTAATCHCTAAWAGHLQCHSRACRPSICRPWRTDPPTAAQDWLCYICRTDSPTAAQTLLQVVKGRLTGWLLLTLMNSSMSPVAGTYSGMKGFRGVSISMCLGRYLQQP